MDLFDRQITLAVNGWHTPFTDGFWCFFSAHETSFLPGVAMLAFLFLRLGWKRALVATGACLLTILLTDMLANVVKVSFERLRPCWDPDMMDAGLRVLEGKGHLYGFFSAHAANALGQATCSVHCLRSRPSHDAGVFAWTVFPLALLIGVSRVFVGKHYVGDVAAGFAAGLLVGWLVGLAARRSLSSVPGRVDTRE